MLTPPRMGRRGKIPVRLTEVDIELRMLVASKLIKSGKMRGVEAMVMDLAAQHPLQDPQINVDEDKAYTVLVEKKLPRGPTPKFQA